MFSDILSHKEVMGILASEGILRKSFHRHLWEDFGDYWDCLIPLWGVGGLYFCSLLFLIIVSTVNVEGQGVDSSAIIKYNDICLS